MEFINSAYLTTHAKNNIPEISKYQHYGAYFIEIGWVCQPRKNTVALVQLEFRELDLELVSWDIFVNFQ